MSKQLKEQSIESLKIHAVKLHYRYAIALSVFTAIAIGMIAGYFLSINVISNAQSQVVNSIELSVKE